ncbi:hypothetical protein WDJ51_15430 [Rathayibacter sp. YIM 133350]
MATREDPVVPSPLGHSEEWVERLPSGQVRPLSPVRIPESEWHLHPLLQRAVRESWIRSTELVPNRLSAIQLRSLEKVHIVVDLGERIMSVPPRFNADPFIDGVAVLSSDDLIGGLAPDLDRFYFRLAEPGGEYLETYAAVSDGRERRFFSTSYGPSWTEISARAFASCFQSEHWSLVEETRAGIHAFERQLMAQFKLEYHIADRSPLDPHWSTFLPDTRSLELASLAQAQATASGRRIAAAADVTASSGSGSHSASAPVAPASEPAAVTPVAQPAPAAPASEAPEAASAPATPAPARETLATTDVVAQPARPAAPVAEVAAIKLLARASAIATIAHRGMTDKLGSPYIDHAARIADSFDQHDEPFEMATAWLHDVIESGGVRANDLLDAGIAPEVVEAVSVLSRRDAQPDEEYYARIRLNPIALRVKLADIADNTAGWRLRRLDDATRVRLRGKYDRARQLLEDEPRAG